MKDNMIPHSMSRDEETYQRRVFRASVVARLLDDNEDWSRGQAAEERDLPLLLHHNYNYNYDVLI